MSARTPPDFTACAEAIRRLFDRFGPEDALPLVNQQLEIMYMRGKRDATDDLIRTMGLVEKVKEAAKNG